MDLNESRHRTANNIYENFDFSYSVKDANGWTSDLDTFEKVVFLEDPEDSSRPSIKGVLTVRFEPGSAVPLEAKAVVRGEEVGNITGGKMSDYVVELPEPPTP